MHWLKTLVIGFSIVSFCVAIGVVGYAVTRSHPTQEPISTENIQQQIQNTAPLQESSDTPPLLIKHVGVVLDTYDPITNKAGDFMFTKQKLQFNRLFMGYGFVIPSNMASSGKDKANPQPTFILPEKTKVHSLVDGIVANVPKLYSRDYSIQVTATGLLEKWVYETEHVINPLVKVGDVVKAGQVIAEVSNYDRGLPPGFGIVEIGILKGGNPPQHVCPFAYLDPLIKEETFTKMKAFFKAWEDYTGDSSLYNQDKTQIPGCLTLTAIEG